MPNPLVNLVPGNPSALEAALANRPELLSHYRSFYLKLWHGGLVPVRVLELCRLRIAFIHGATAELAVRHRQAGVADLERDALARMDFSVFSDAEQAALTLAELMPHQHHAIDDAQVDRVRQLFGESGTVNLLAALAFFDVTSRLKLVWALPEEGLEFDGTKLV